MTLAQLEVIETLMGDAWRRAKWASLNDLEYDDSKAMANLKMWHETVYGRLVGDQLLTDTDNGASLISWAETQGRY